MIEWRAACITFTTLGLRWGRRVLTAIYKYTFIPYEKEKGSRIMSYGLYKS